MLDTRGVFCGTVAALVRPNPAWRRTSMLKNIFCAERAPRVKLRICRWKFVKGFFGFWSCKSHGFFGLVKATAARCREICLGLSTRVFDKSH